MAAVNYEVATSEEGGWRACIVSLFTQHLLDWNGYGGESMQLRIAAIFTALNLLTCPQQVVGETSFPLLQDGGARDSFVRSAAGSCIKKYIDSPETKAVAQDVIVKSCNCYARALADIINAQEFEALASGEMPDSLLKKADRASKLCEPT
jgi:hypothetical protein